MTEKQIIKKIYTVSKELDQDIYIVGGFVRDELLGIKHKKDLDFVVVGSGLEFAKKFDLSLEEEGSLVEFPDFDTARYVLDDFEIEFAGARMESYDSDSRKPHVKPATLEMDLSRRDFTVNAMARKVMSSGLSSKILDPFEGQQDLKKKIIRTPLEPNETFSDDPLRMMRAARFAAQLEFEIEENTYKALDKNAKRLKIISAERIQEELFKMLSTLEPSKGLWILYKTGLLSEFLPEVVALGGVEEVAGYAHKNNLSHSFKVVDNIAQMSDKSILRFAGLMHDIGKADTKKFVKGRGWTFDMHDHLGKKMVRQIGRRLRMSKGDIEYVAHLVRWHLYPIALMDEGVTDSPVRRLIVNLQEDLDDLLILCRADITTGNQKKLKRRLKNYDYLEKRIVEVLEKDKLRAFQSPVRGEEIMKECGLGPGPTVGKIKIAIEEAILDGIIANEYEPALEYFKKIKDEYMKDVQDWEKV